MSHSEVHKLNTIAYGHHINKKSFIKHEEVHNITVYHEYHSFLHVCKFTTLAQICAVVITHDVHYNYIYCEPKTTDHKNPNTHTYQPSITCKLSKSKNSVCSWHILFYQPVQVTIQRNTGNINIKNNGHCTIGH